MDLFCPELNPPAKRLSKKDLDPIATEGADWLVKAPKIEETVIGADGLPLYLPCVDPRVFALHKLWLSKVPSRQVTSRSRDRAQEGRRGSGPVVPQPLVQGQGAGVFAIGGNSRNRRTRGRHQST